jgi:glyoxylase-like metal-dependent hydrolase (beta-lactamase superfamily II)
LSATASPAPGNLDVRWHAGWPSPKHDTAPEIQVHHYRPDTVILRQNKSVNYEAPFLFLLLGNDSALLLDTGATPEPEYFPLRRTVDRLIEEWLAEHPRPGYRLIVAHTHGHGDHVQGDGQFADRPDTTVVARDLGAVTEFFGLAEWPNGAAEVDLGGRVVDVVPAPGHQVTATLFYDRETGLLFTGDTLCRGRLYVFDWPTYVETAHRMADFVDEHPVTHVLGCHIEMTTTPDRDYHLGTTYQPDEPPLEMSADHVHALRRAVDEVGDRPGVHPFGDFIIHHLDTSR